MKSLKSLSTESILKEYPWPHRFLVAFAVACAEKALASIKDPDPRSLKAISLAKRFSQGEDISTEELKTAADSAYAAYYAAYAAYSADSAAAYYAHAAHAAAHHAYYADSAYYAAYAHAYVASKKLEKELKIELISMIKKEFSEFELIMMGVEK